MRAEDVKEGMWVRTLNGPGRVLEVGITGLVSLAGPAEWVGARGWWGHAALEPWTPRVGDWVRASDHTVHRVSAWLPHAGFAGCALVDDGGKPRRIPLDQCEPCAEPEAKAATFKKHDAGAYQFTREEVEQVSSNPRTWLDMVAQAFVPRVVYGWDLPDPIRAVPIEGDPRALELAGPALYSATMKRDHNATCAKCGGKAYQGIGAVRCVEPVCDDPKTRMPESVTRVVDVRQRKSVYDESWVASVERIYQSTGRGVTKRHPTKEGAILAWREAVNRG